MTCPAQAMPTQPAVAKAASVFRIGFVLYLMRQSLGSTLVEAVLTSHLFLESVHNSVQTLTWTIQKQQRV